MERILTVSDFHFPFHDETCFEIFLKFLHYLQPDLLLFLGDVMDMYGLSRFTKTKEEWLSNLQYELDTAVDSLGRIRKVYKGPVKYIEGNHEWRLKKYLLSNAKELSSLRCLSINKLLKLDKFKIEYIDSIDGSAIYAHKKDLLFTHGSLARKHSSYTAKALFDKFMCNALQGHTHRMGFYNRRTYNSNFVTAEIGCMCNINDTFTEVPDWQNGFAVTYRKGAFCSVDLLPIKQKMLVYQGNVFTKNGRSRI